MRPKVVEKSLTSFVIIHMASPAIDVAMANHLGAVGFKGVRKNILINALKGDYFLQNFERGLPWGILLLVENV